MARSLAGTISCGRTTTRTAARPSWRALVKLCARHGTLAPFVATCHRTSSCRCEAASWLYAECTIASSPQLCGQNRRTSSSMFAPHREAVSKVDDLEEPRWLPLCSKPQNSECVAARQALTFHSHTNHAVNKQHSTLRPQAVIDRSERRFTGDEEADPTVFLAWLLNALHADLTAGARKAPSIITACFQVRLPPHAWRLQRRTMRTCPNVQLRRLQIIMRKSTLARHDRSSSCMCKASCHS